MVESGTSLNISAHVHDNNDTISELVESSISSQISRYSFSTRVIEDGSIMRLLILASLHLVGHLNPLVLIMVL